ncbi:transglycosylase SLT domain-containing protein [Gloeobacter morelensis]|uniref:Transglycosylase SLT domain-containing protein n=1 Tax=Gloeobacter morelensis MG652769 TaxID=2781736 RepID=A0ABY3PGN9_9CYAN|nr:transglycosylase SLT domain-containing protein [Gloeobacter morelensis]UFP92809.1 transglycosylase SLT domain-containing protein [Gloeobacter morelensis MG652769]
MSMPFRFKTRTLLIAASLAGALGLAWVAFSKPQTEGGTLVAVSSQDRSGRYRRGSAAFERGDYAEARRQLAGLAASYPALAERIGLKLAVASGEGRRWLEAHPKSPLVPDALALLARQDRAALLQLLNRYSDHYRTREALERALVRDPDDRSLAGPLIARFPESTLAYAMATRREKTGALSPAEWQLVASIYRRVNAKQALAAYERAPAIPENLLERARLQRKLGDKPAARELYELVPRRFPKSPLVLDAAFERAELLGAGEAFAALEPLERAFAERGDEVLWARSQIAVRQLSAPEMAIPLYRRLVERYPTSAKAPNAAWELAAQSAERGNTGAARSYARWLVRNHPADPFAPKAAFWLGKWAEQAGAAAEARSQFREVLKRYPRSYYAWRSATRLGLADGSYDIDRAVVSVRWSQPPLPLEGTSAALRELLALGEISEAEQQWQSETYRRKLSPAQKLAESQLRARLGQHLRSINQATLTLLAAPPADPRAWEQAYPLFYAPGLRQWSQQRKLNPLLVASLIRQESRFEPAVRSRSGAMGLMQIMPATARFIAEREPGAFELTNPVDNLRLGTWYLRYTHERFGGSTMLALASYNAGPGNVSKWLKRNPVTNEEDFIEQIPFKETRFYVVNIYENYWNYLRLYSSQGRQALAAIDGRTAMGGSN